MTRQSKGYAAALFELAKEQNALEPIRAALGQLCACFEENPAYPEFLACPGIPLKERMQALQTVLADAPETFRTFALLLVKHGAIRVLPACAREFDVLYQAQTRRSAAIVTSAAPLSDEQKKRLCETLEKRSGHTVEATYRVDPALLGGVTVQMDGTVMDGSLKSRLTSIKEVIE